MSLRARRAFPWVVLVVAGGGLGAVLLSAVSCAVAPQDDCAALATCSMASDVANDHAVGDSDGAADDTGDAAGGGDGAAASESSESSESNETGDAGEGAAQSGDASNITAAPPCPWGYQCLPAPPDGWFHSALWQGEPGDTPPPCPAGYGPALLDGYQGLNAPAASCSSSCTATGQECAPCSASIFNDLACFSSCLVGGAVPAGTCSAVTGCTGRQGTLMAQAGAPYGGSCTPNVQMSVPPITWSAAARTCITRGPINASCGGDEILCIESPAPPFVSQPCLVRIVPEGMAVPSVCPSPYSNGPNIYYRNASDTRGCSSANCGDAGPTGGSCGGTISLTGAVANDCTTGAFSYVIGSGCSSPFTLTGPVSHITASYTLTPGSCAVATAASPTGAAQPAGPAQVVCCM